MDFTPFENRSSFSPESQNFRDQKWLRQKSLEVFWSWRGVEHKNFKQKIHQFLNSRILRETITAFIMHNSIRVEWVTSNTTASYLFPCKPSSNNSLYLYEFSLINNYSLKRWLELMSSLRSHGAVPRKCPLLLICCKHHHSLGASLIRTTWP